MNSVFAPVGNNGMIQLTGDSFQASRYVYTGILYCRFLVILGLFPDCRAGVLVNAGTGSGVSKKVLNY